MEALHYTTDHYLTGGGTAAAGGWLLEFLQSLEDGVQQVDCFGDASGAKEGERGRSLKKRKKVKKGK